MILWSSSIELRCPPETLFTFLANLQEHVQSEDSPVKLIELTTEGPPRLGSQYREIVQMAPFYRGQILSRITAFDQPWVLELEWTGPGMRGFDRYELSGTGIGTLLRHTKQVEFPGLLRVFEPLLRLPLIPRLEQRLVEIKALVEGDRAL